MSVHANLTGADLHEPKGVASANSGEIYVADGATSGAWTAEKYVLNVEHRDAANATSVYVVVPYAGTITKIWTIIDGTFDADTDLTPKIGTTTITAPTLTITASGSALADIDSTVPTALNTVVAGDYIQIASDGAGTTVGDISITIEISRT